MRRLLYFIGFSIATTCAHAQSSVTIFGIMDSGVYFQNRTGNGGSGVSALDGAWAPSVWGMTGTEDLGNGYHAVFKLGSGISTTSGGFGNSNGNLFGWNTYVGVDGPYGNIHAGVQFSPFFLSIFGDDARGGPQYASNVSVYFDRFGGTGLFESNSLIYTSPTIAGFEASVEYAFGNVPGSPAAGHHYSAALNYRLGPFSATLAYFQANAPQTSQTAFIGQNIGVGYKVGPIEVHASYTKYRNELLANCNDVDVYAGGLAWLLTSSFSFNAGVYYSRDANVSANKSLLVGAGSQYVLSKRTTLYTQLGVVNNKGEMRSEIASNAPNFVPGLGTTTGVNIGITHKF
ncbi:porin [Paraburkholderia ferrariae]|uniref:porin n=1 Tax=Paraburkholderia ferrariae TaxID=386056 RepID=UPI000481A549|nr:porin [Paraburkholderia ferrariae]